MNKRLRQLLRQATYNLRGGFLVRPLIIALALGCAGAMLAWLEETFPAFSDVVPRAIFPSHADPQVAQFILGGIAASIMTVVSIVFAILLMTLTLASMQFSPRIIVSFVKDRVTQWTLGIFLGTFCYCMAALPAARSTAAALRAGGHGDGRDAAGAGLRGLAAVLHPPHFARHQRQPHRRPHCPGDRTGDR